VANLSASNSTLNGDSFVALLVQLVWNVTENSNVTNLTNTASTISFTPADGRRVQDADSGEPRRQRRHHRPEHLSRC
jgi:hypothetical protein